MAEDNPADVGLVREALAHHGLEGDFEVYTDGEAMLAAIERVQRGETPPPDIILLDLNLPRHGGIAILHHLRNRNFDASVPVGVVTSSNLQSDREAAARLGAAMYFCKPLDYEEFMALGGIVKQILTASGSRA
jgi:CheY-like chemotaxis protein